MTDTTNTQTEGPMEAWIDAALAKGNIHLRGVRDKAREVDAQLREAIAQRDAAEANAQNLSRLRAEAEKAVGFLDRRAAVCERRADRLAEALRELLNGIGVCNVDRRWCVNHSMRAEEGAVMCEEVADAAAALAGEPGAEPQSE